MGVGISLVVLVDGLPPPAVVLGVADHGATKAVRGGRTEAEGKRGQRVLHLKGEAAEFNS